MPVFQRINLLSKLDEYLCDKMMIISINFGILKKLLKRMN